MAIRYERIFAALDGSSTQRAVIERAIRIAHDNQAELYFGHVIDSVPYQGSGGVDYDLMCSQAASRIKEELKEFFDAAQDDECIPSVEFKVCSGRIADTLMRQLIKPFKPDLVICGERGLSNVRYAFVGSVSTALIRRVRCDVLVIKQD